MSSKLSVGLSVTTVTEIPGTPVNNLHFIPPIGGSFCHLILSYLSVSFFHLFCPALEVFAGLFLVSFYSLTRSIWSSLVSSSILSIISWCSSNIISSSVSESILILFSSSSFEDSSLSDYKSESGPSKKLVIASSLILEAVPSVVLLPCLPSAILLIKEVIILISLADLIFWLILWQQQACGRNISSDREPKLLGIYLICMILCQTHFLQVLPMRNIMSHTLKEVNIWFKHFCNLRLILWIPGASAQIAISSANWERFTCASRGCRMLLTYDINRMGERTTLWDTMDRGDWVT